MQTGLQLDSKLSPMASIYHRTAKSEVFPESVGIEIEAYGLDVELCHYKP